MSYNPQEIETKWQRIWKEKRAFRTETWSHKPKYYVLDMFPYPSGHGLHVGHLKGYVASDVVARYRRMRGYNVLHPMGWDSFGLPTERQAERDQMHPRDVTRRNIETFKRQLNSVGLCYDWDRVFATSDPEFYRWTQWFFLILLERGLAYESEVPVNWCPTLQTVLANEEVKDGVYIETGDPVGRRVMRQWMLKITAYADRLLEDLDLVDWPEEVKELQRNWIGRREGASIWFRIDGHDRGFEVFSTRPETVFGCTFCVLAPEHELVAEITTAECADEVKGYVDAVAALSERERLARSEEKTGVFTGAYTINPLTGQLVPIWVADYVLAGYGTGAVFGCPAHDERDFAFAQKVGLDIIWVVDGGECDREVAYTGDGVMINSDFLDGFDTRKAKQVVTTHLEANGLGQKQVIYNLRDWLFSRQRFWGEPIPVVHASDGSIEPVPMLDLPVLLPDSLPEESEAADSGPSAPLARAVDWVRTVMPSSGQLGERETNVMPQWAGSSWYYLRFIDPRNASAAFDKDAEKAWMPVDLYVGGIEHATLHLLYARFWHKVLYDAGYVSTPEPFARLFNQGMVHARSFRDDSGRYYYPDDVVERDSEWFTIDGVGPLNSRIEKMSKSRYNVVSPETVIAEFGADSLRLYECFMGPLEDNAVWQSDGISGMRRFLDRLWRVFEACLEDPVDADEPVMERLLHQTIRKVTSDLESLRLNTAISQLMIFTNEASARKRISREAMSCVARLLAPLAPHVTEEMWLRLGGDRLVLDAPWPKFDPEKCIEEQVTFVVQVNGKLRARLSLPRDLSEDQVRELAFNDKIVSRWLEKGRIRRCIFVPNKLLNIVTQ